MKDHWSKKIIKNLARHYYMGSLWLNRKKLKRKGLPRYELTGKCESCAKCCEKPAIAIGPITNKISFIRFIYIAWQKHINGFIFLEHDKEKGVLYFTCSHFDTFTRKCDSYDSRPGMCRDYPRNLLYTSIPDFFVECGYKPKDKNADRFNIALDKAKISEEKKEKIRKKLFLK